MTKALYWFLCFLYILGPVINTPLGIYGDPILLVSIFLSICLFCIKYNVLLSPHLFLGVFEKSLFALQIYIILPLLGAMFFPMYGGEISVADIIRPLRILLTMYAGLALVLFGDKLYSMLFFQKILKVIVYIMILNALVMCLQTLFTPFRDFMQLFLYKIDDGVNRIGIELRASGLFLSGGALPSVFQTMVTVFIPYLILQKEFSCWWGILLALFLFVSSIFTGRSGILVSIPFLYSTFLFLSLRQSMRILLFIMLGVVLFVSYVGMFESEAFVYAIERFSWLGNESKDSGTIAVILNKLSVPKDIFVFLFGVLNFNNAIYVHVSDMGFNIKLWTYGIIGWFLYYGAFVKMFFVVYLFKSSFYKTERRVVLIFLLTYLLFEFKENMMYARNGLSILSLVIYGYLVYRHKIRQSFLNYKSIGS